MKKKTVVLGLMVLVVGSCSACGVDVSKVEWAPTMDDVMEEPNIKLVVFLRDRGITPEGGLGGVKDWEEIGRIEEHEKVEQIMGAIEMGDVCPAADNCVEVWDTWMGVVNGKNQGLLINIGFNELKERVEWWGRYSEELYDVLVKYGIVKPAKKPIFVNEPDVVHFEAPPEGDLQKEVKVITITRGQDLEQMYMKIDPNVMPVYVKVDPKMPGVYIAVDSNLADTYLRELLPGINLMKEASEELMAQNRWLSDRLNKCIERLESERGLGRIPRKYELRLRGDPNVAEEYPEGHEPFFIPYERAVCEPFAEDAKSIRLLAALVNLHVASLRMYLASAGDWIENFEERLVRIDANEP